MMDIRRAVSQGANWVLSLGHVPALLEMIDEHQIPVEICLTQGTGAASFRANTLFCRRVANRLILRAPNVSIQVDLERLSEARAVSRATGFGRQISLQLVARSGVAWLGITGPAMAEGLAGQVWQTVMESLRSEHTKALRQEIAVDRRPLDASASGRRERAVSGGSARVPYGCGGEAR
jgi:hypothetical protein